MNTWNIIIEGFNKADITKHESIFSLGNGAMGMRANFEEDYTGDTLQGSYIGGVYYPDKTRVGWWKNGYPEYFAKVLNAPNWIGLHIKINGELLDLNTCLEVKNFRRQLNMKEGWYERSFTAMLSNQQEIQVKVLRFLSLRYDELGALRYEITPLTTEATIEIESYLDSGIKNSDANWDERFWNTLEISSENNCATILAETKKTRLKVHTFMQNQLFIDNKALNISSKENKKENYIGLQYEVKVEQNQTFIIEKYGGYSISNDYSTLTKSKTLSKSIALFDSLLENQREDWAHIWETSDIVIEGDEKAQQGIRFNIFQLNQTYSGK